jgi:sterol desaturase/sphingolipid hydroxylase (fatty acid hydroxylase superfamily)/uncharacterized protein (DUF2147 family)
MFKKIFQFGIYPLIMLAAGALLIYGMQNGYNYYVVSITTITVFGLIILLLERQLPYEKSWVSNWDWNLDLVYYIINYAIKLVAQLQFLWLTTIFDFPDIFPTQLPFWLQVILSLTLMDFFLFYVHKISHKYLFLWDLHAIHHSSERLYFLNGEKRHALHQILEGAPGIILCLVIGTPHSVLITALALLAINMFMQHTNLDYKAGILKKVFCVAELHRWHHRADYHDAQVNFGAWLTIWDYLFGTAYDNPKMAKDLGAIGIKEEPNFPKSYASQFLYPFSKKIKNKSKNALTLTLLFFFISFTSAAQSANDIIGKWTSPDNTMVIEIYGLTNTFHAKIIQGEVKKHIGKTIFWGLVYDDNARKWAKGKVQKPNMHHEVECVVELKDSDTLLITGYHGIKTLGTTEKWLRESNDSD